MIRISQEYERNVKRAATPEQALSAFGRILHAVQDFLSHSNYVEIYLVTTAQPIAKHQRDKHARMADPDGTDVIKIHPDSLPAVWPPRTPNPMYRLATGYFGWPFGSAPPGERTHGDLNKTLPRHRDGSTSETNRGGCTTTRSEPQRTSRGCTAISSRRRSS